MVPGDAHVSIDSVLFTLAVDEDSHYQQRFEPLFAPSQAIAGEAAADNIRQEKIIWSLTDWSGGEGAVRYYPQNPTQYDTGTLINPTKRGQLTTRTKRRRSAVARAGSNADAAKRPYGTSAYTHAIIGWEDNIVVSSDAISWSAAQDTSPALSGFDHIDAISDGTNAAILSDGVSSADLVAVVEADSSTTTWSDTDSGGAVATVNTRTGFVLDGLPYLWAIDTDATPDALTLVKKATGMDTASDWAATKVFASGITPVGTWGTNFWTDAVAAETAAYISYSTKTHGFVWEVRNDVARPFYTADPGFAIKKLIYKSGFLFMLGNFHAAGSSFAEMRAIPLTTGQVIEGVSQPRRHQNTTFSTFDVGCAANEAGIFMADRSTGKIFYYDIKNDATHLFDDLVNGGTGDGVDFVSGEDNISFLDMHGARLFCATYNTADTGVTSLQVISWDDLEVQNRDASQAISANVIHPEWDFGLPNETKRLGRIIVNYKVTDTTTTSGLTANSRITVSYLPDDGAANSGNYTDTTTITSATTPSGVKGRVVIAAPTGSSTVLFSRLKVKITLDNNSSAVAPPIVYSVMIEAEPAAYERIWELALRVEDETSNYRVTSRQESAQQVLDRLTTIKTNKRWVTFLDGFPSTLNNDYDTYTVCIDDLIADMKGDGTGIVRLRLRQQQS